MRQSDQNREKPDRFWRSWLAGKTAGCIVLLGLLFLVKAGGTGSDVLRNDIDAFICRTSKLWQAKHKNTSNLQVARVDVRFSSRPGVFARGEGFVAVPTALHLAGAQEIVSSTAFPNPVRWIDVEGIRNVFWEYAGKTNREMRFVALTLVKRPKAGSPLPALPTHERLDPQESISAVLNAEVLSEHSLDKCAEFEVWAASTAGDPPHVDQFSRILKAIHPYITEDEEKTKRAENVCASIRQRVYTPHRAQVAAVMAAREVGIPAYGFTAADSTAAYLVGTFVDGIGWVYADVQHPKAAFSSRSPALVTRAPLAVGFEASRHNLWYPSGAAYRAGGYLPGSLYPLSLAEWKKNQDQTEEHPDYTDTSTIALEKLCP